MRQASNTTIWEDFMTKIINKFILVTISIILTAIGASLALKAAIGVGAWDALSQSTSIVLGIKVGTFSMLMNLSCVLIQLLILRKDFKINHVLQIFVAVLLGNIVNFMFYNVFSKLTVNSYSVSLLLFILSMILVSVGVATIMATNLTSFPLEGACMVIAQKINKNFGTVRQFVDIVSIALALGITFVFKNRITVREGTVIGMIIFGPLLDFLIKLMKPKLIKLDLAA